MLFEWLRHGCFDSGSASPKPPYFLLHGQKKVGKEKAAPAARRPLRFSLDSGLARGRLRAPAGEDAHPCAPPSGLCRIQLRCSARHKGTERQRRNSSLRRQRLTDKYGRVYRTVGAHRRTGNVVPSRSMGAVDFDVGTPVARRASQALADRARRGTAGMRSVVRQARAGLSDNPRQRREAQGMSRRRGGLSFGDFSLAVQRKVTRPRGRIPRIKKIRGEATPKNFHCERRQRNHGVKTHDPRPRRAMKTNNH
jgi:hypothetical protein